MLLALVVSLAGGVWAAWRAGGFDYVKLRTIDVEPGQLITVNDTEFTFTTATFRRDDSDGSVRMYINGTCRNTTDTGQTFLSWFDEAIIVFGPGVDGGPNSVADFTYPSVPLSPYGAPAFNPTDAPLPCRVLATFPNGLGPSEHVTVAMGQVRPVTDLFEVVTMGRWAPATYDWYRIRVPMTEEE